MAPSSQIFKTGFETLVSPLFTHPQESQECQKMPQDPLNMPVEVCCAKIAPKLKNIWKSPRKQGFFDIFSSILIVLEVDMCLLRAILAQKEDSFICRKKKWFFDTPGTPGSWSIVERNFFGPSCFEVALVRNFYATTHFLALNFILDFITMIRRFYFWHLFPGGLWAGWAY